MKLKLTILLGALLLLTACNGRKDTGIPSSTEGSVLISDRLSNQRVNSFAEDADGHIWIATARGLDKYSVHEYHQYFCADDTLGLPDNQVNSVFFSKKGQLWAGTADGVGLRTDEGRFTRIPVLGDGRNVNRFWENTV